jgi:SAM-dependent methyltransferase
MPEMDIAAEVNRRGREAHPSTPALDIDVAELKQFVAAGATGRFLPGSYPSAINPPSLLRDIGGKRVLCLASGGGQQSAFFGILGARVTVLDIAEAQLQQDRIAADHYGYPVRTERGDMRDLSRFADESFDHVDMGLAIYAVPDVMPVYTEVARVLRPGGTYRVEHMNPGTMSISHKSWDGSGYRLCVPYRRGRTEPDNPESYNYLHFFSDIFNGLTAAGLAVKEVWESPMHTEFGVRGDPGTYEHTESFVQCNFSVVAEKALRNPKKRG